MDTKAVANNSEPEFNTVLFEKRLTTLKDSQESINTCCHWCLQNRQHHKKIVTCWLNVLKRVKIDHRLTLFYLANDVIQYSKRRNYDFVESWGTTLQKATTMVRDEKVKHKILRIFKIWEQRGIYGEEFVTDLCGLISASPSTRKGDEPHEFQSCYLIQKIRSCSRLEGDTDVKLRQLKEHNPKIQLDGESLIASLKDRAHVDDVEKEMEEYTKQMESYITALRSEIKARTHLITLLTQADTQLENDKKDVKVVTTAYRTFASRVKTLKKKLDEMVPSLNSPVPSPDINAPSPSPDSDIELPGNDPISNMSVSDSLNNSSGLYTNAGYYNPVPPPSSETNTDFNNISSFFGGNMQFSLANLNTSSLFGNNQGQNTIANATSQTQTTNSYSVNDAISSLFPSMACPPPPPAPTIATTTTDYQYTNSGHVPLMPPPMPPFSKSDDGYGGSTYGDAYTENNSNYANPVYDSTSASYQPSTQQTYQAPSTTFEPTTTTYQSPATTFPLSPSFAPPTTAYQQFNSNYPPPLSVPPPYQSSTPNLPNYQSPIVPLTNSYPSVDEYNPEEELETWDPEPTWEQPNADLDTPESPPLFEKEGYVDPVEYHDNNMFEGRADVDHRILPRIIMGPTTIDEKVNHRAKDIDHRNLISLTGSPNETRSSWTSQGDQDYRKPIKQSNLDQDYRVPLQMENFNIPPPPPPPKLNNKTTDCTQSLTTNSNNNSSKNPTKSNNNQQKRHGLSPRKLQDNNESIDMDLSDDEQDLKNSNGNQKSRMNIVKEHSSMNASLQLPPPFPELLDDVDANNFLDNVNEELESFETDDFEIGEPLKTSMKPGLLGEAPSASMETQSRPMNFHNMSHPPPAISDSLNQPNWTEQNFNSQYHQGRSNFSNRGGPHTRGNWGNNRGGNTDFRGRGRGIIRGMPPRGGGVVYRGNNRGGFRGNNNWGMGRNRGNVRTRGSSRGNFRGGF